MEFKTRSPLYLRQISDEVKARLDTKATELGVAQWLIVEKVLENTLGIDNEVLDLAKWLGVTKNNVRIGKPYKKVSKK